MAERLEIKPGDRIGCYTILRQSFNRNNGRVFLCECECGVVEEKRLGVLRRTSSPQCRHNRLDRSKVVKRIHSVWCGMKNRCYNQNVSCYENYGGRGIKICDEWLNDYYAFEKWALSNGYADDLTIDRIDNDGDYTPYNCRWVDKFVQSNNRRNNVVLTYKGESLTIGQWATKLGIHPTTIHGRLKTYGYTIPQALGFEKVKWRRPPRPNQRKPVYQIDRNGNTVRIWDSVQQIHEELGIPIQSINHACIGRKKYVRGFMWKRKHQLHTQKC